MNKLSFVSVLAIGMLLVAGCSKTTKIAQQDVIPVQTPGGATKWVHDPRSDVNKSSEANLLANGGTEITTMGDKKMAIRFHTEE